MTSMTIPPPEHSSLKKFGFNVHKDGKFVREQLVEATDPALAEARVYRHLSDGEYPWYVVPRLVENVVAVVELAVGMHGDTSGEVAA